MSVVDSTKYAYETTKIVGADGKVRHSRSNGDAVAQAMKHVDPAEAMKVNGLEDKLGHHQKTMNPGQFRMLVGNSLRARVKRGEKVKIGRHSITDLTQEIPVTKAEKEALRKATNKSAPAPAKAKPAKAGKEKSSKASTTA